MMAAQHIATTPSTVPGVTLEVLHDLLLGLQAGQSRLQDSVADLNKKVSRVELNQGKMSNAQGLLVESEMRRRLSNNFSRVALQAASIDTMERLLENFELRSCSTVHSALAAHIAQACNQGSLPAPW
jgi:hypothetical protein